MNDSAALGPRLTGLADPGVPQRPAQAWLDESVGWIALLATRHTYAAQPALWELGEWGRARTIEDFTHHLRAAIAGSRHWRRHVAYCLTLFDRRGYPFRWLTDAFATLSVILAEELPQALTIQARTVLGSGAPLLRQLAGEAGVHLDRPTRYDA